ncbi:chemotaxis protein, partial [bacterium]|nr:chemotaxis protein [bacterium]
MKLGTKIAVGFGAVLCLAVALGGFGMLQMNAVKGDAQTLSREYVPEVDLCNQVERNTLLMMYANRGYGLSEENHFYETGQEQKNEVERYLEECDAL